MKNLIYKIFTFLIISFFSISCERSVDELEIVDNNIQANKETLETLKGKTTLAIDWDFVDYETQEAYNIMEVNSEYDSVYLHFNENFLLIVSVHYPHSNDTLMIDDGLEIVKIGHSFYKWSVWYYEYGESGEIFIKKDEMTKFKITDLNRNSINFEGSHAMHNQFQTNEISFAIMTTNPEIVDDLIN